MSEIVIGSAGVVENSRGEFLVIKRDEPALKEFHGNIELPGGKVEIGENPVDTVLREIFEETGYSTEFCYMIPVLASNIVKYPDHSFRIIVNYHCCELLSGEVSCTHTKDEKVSDVFWLSLDEIKKSKTTPGTVEAIEAYLLNIEYAIALKKKDDES